MFERPGFMRLTGLAVLILATGCGDDSSSAGAPSATGVAPRTGSPPSTSGDEPVGILDAGATADAAAPAQEMRDVLVNECATIDGVSFAGEDTPVEGGFFTGVSLPDDFPVTRVEATWEPGCLDPTFRITLSEGRCPDGRGQELVFFLEAEAIATGLVHTGQNQILEDPGTRGIRVRYRRPDDESPSGEWGTCDLASGTLDLIGDVELVPRGDLQGRFQLELTPCDGDTEGTQTLQGTFDTIVRRSELDFCPTESP